MSELKYPLLKMENLILNFTNWIKIYKIETLQEISEIQKMFLEEENAESE